MVERESPLGAAHRPGRHGNVAERAGVQLTETQPGSIIEIVAWPGLENSVLSAIRKATGLTVPDRPGGGVSKSGTSCFGFAPGRWLMVDQAENLGVAIDVAAGVVNDLSHGRTAIRISGDKAEWVLSKFFALDFAVTAFPVGDGRATAHHDIFAQIQRTGVNQFDIYVFRSFARAFWMSLCHAAEEVGYDVV
jgi:methylglutamate dehydrogenase subunit D